jgi:3-oxoacyl-[acyl-carrier protein] reductase
LTPTRPDSRVVIVTGGAAGIGRATAARFAQAGDHVAVWDVRPPDAELPGITYQRVDVTDPAAVEAATAEVVARWGRIDVLVNNAGIVKDAQLVKWQDGRQTGAMSEADFDAVISVNLKGVFLCTRAVVPHLIAGGGGAILNASSVVGLYGNFGQTNYAATKAGVISLTRTWARELGRHDIRVNAVAPGFIATEMALAIPEKVLQGMIAHTPLGRMGKPEDVAEAYYWLASDAAAFISGAVLSVDGGLVIGT